MKVLVLNIDNIMTDVQFFKSFWIGQTLKYRIECPYITLGHA